MTRCGGPRAEGQGGIKPLHGARNVRHAPACPALPCPTLPCPALPCPATCIHTRAQTSLLATPGEKGTLTLGARENRHGSEGRSRRQAGHHSENTASSAPQKRDPSVAPPLAHAIRRLCARRADGAHASKAQRNRGGSRAAQGSARHGSVKAAFPHHTPPRRHALPSAGAKHALTGAW